MQPRFKGMCREIARKIRTTTPHQDFNEKHAQVFLWEFTRLAKRELAKGNKVTIPGIGTFQAQISREFPRTAPENGLRRKLAHLRIKSRWNRPMIDFIRTALLAAAGDRQPGPPVKTPEFNQRTIAKTGPNE